MRRATERREYAAVINVICGCPSNNYAGGPRPPNSSRGLEDLEGGDEARTEAKSCVHLAALTSVTVFNTTLPSPTAIQLVSRCGIHAHTEYTELTVLAWFVLFRPGKYLDRSTMLMRDVMLTSKQQSMNSAEYGD